MAGFDKLKLNKQLIKSATEAGYAVPKEIQQKTLTRIIGGQDIIAIAPEGFGKTTAYILGTLNRFNYSPEGVPKVLILVPEKEDVLAVIEQFELLNKNNSIAIVGLYVTPGTEAQMDALADGADIVVATPDRARAIYLKLALNLNKMELLIIDDADRMIKKGMQLPITELANSIGKCQHLVFTDVMHSRIEKLVAPFMNLPAIIEVEALEESPVKTHQQLLYNVPNFPTKVNLLNLFMYDEEVFTKAVVFVNKQATAEKVFQSLNRRIQDAVGYFKPRFFDVKGFNTVADFKAEADARVLIVVTENEDAIELDGIPFLIHFDLPADKETYIQRVTNNNTNSEDETLALTFATDLDLSLVKRIEQATGKKMQPAALPDDLVIVNDVKPKATPTKQSTKTTEPETGAAFHEKKASNNKNYNFSSGQKAKMNMKKKHG
ncbi:DEAD/DEAH box helicase [Mucilaginibacter sp. UR6-11]|uniref:DEAD/DEAH box helicase n=1 Tax=Mucilaginibacter sp. UR6-11 TaxID=1435644 RepID=UPI001E50CEF6|nr:DEAD/DEAH box helicase [Mucilaginibacter sp. UR6-11]MCC8426091.1 DEAD/DEAH box helicase [Mucilaginibacter sp. UR6-11]